MVARPKKKKKKQQKDTGHPLVCFKQMERHPCFLFWFLCCNYLLIMKNKISNQTCFFSYYNQKIETENEIKKT